MAKSRIFFFRVGIIRIPCGMETKPKQPHPLLANVDRISAEGIIVFNNVTDLPAVGGPFVSPDYVICIGQRGVADVWQAYVGAELAQVGVLFVVMFTAAVVMASGVTIY